VQAKSAIAQEARPRALAWPNTRKVVLFAGLSLALFVEFLLVYFPLNAFAASGRKLVRLYFDWELSIPFVPGMIYFYFSLNALTGLSLFRLDERGLRRYALAVGAAILFSGIFFLLFPAQLGFPWPKPVPGHEFFFEALYSVDKPHNLFPSLHITLSALSVRVMAESASRFFVGTLLAWLLLIGASVLLVHQHHVLDVLGGLVLAELCYRKFYRESVSADVQSPK
jgi:membrane-associated phospholipid phosphatase